MKSLEVQTEILSIRKVDYIEQNATCAKTTVLKYCAELCVWELQPSECYLNGV